MVVELLLVQYVVGVAPGPGAGDLVQGSPPGEYGRGEAGEVSRLSSS